MLFIFVVNTFGKITNGSKLEPKKKKKGQSKARYDGNVSS